MQVKVAVLCADASGNPCFHKSCLEVGEFALSEGLHYDRAIKEARSLGYQSINGAMIAFDGSDVAATQLAHLDDWFEE